MNPATFHKYFVVFKAYLSLIELVEFPLYFGRRNSTQCLRHTIYNGLMAGKKATSEH